MSDVEKSTSDIVKITSDLIFHTRNTLKNKPLQQKRLTYLFYCKPKRYAFFTTYALFPATKPTEPNPHELKLFLLNLH